MPGLDFQNCKLTEHLPKGRTTLSKSSPIKSSQTYRSVSEWFASQAVSTPDAVAIVHEEERLTYAELDSRSNEVAKSLRVAGVDSECVVGLCTTRSAFFVVGAL